MLFPTFDYFVFLPAVAAIHWALGSRAGKTVWLLLASLVFYAAWNPVDTLLLSAIIGMAYTFGRVISSQGEDRRGTTLLFAAVSILAPLFFYKYVAFLGENVHALWPAFQAPPRRHLPIGISFYSFQALAYVIDVRRGQAAERNVLRFSTFLLFFPHLVAGPILRASNLLGQIDSDRTLSRADVGHGIARLSAGLVKKVMAADVLRLGMVDSVFTDPGAFTGPEVMVALYAYTLQIYCDFSGYTDFAIGSARLFGFHIPENFDRPYQALSVANYWRRWHMTLSDWVRDYVYYPIGGSRGGGLLPYRNTMITLIILGIWHGANWTFVVYGCLHGLAVSVNRYLRKGKEAVVAPGVLGTACRWLLTFHFVVLARILFRSDSLTHAAQVAGALTRFEWSFPRFSVHAWVVLVVGYVVHLTPRAWLHRARDTFAAQSAVVQGVFLAAVAAAAARWGAGDSLSFIYYDF